MKFKRIVVFPLALMLIVSMLPPFFASAAGASLGADNARDFTWGSPTGAAYSLMNGSISWANQPQPGIQLKGSNGSLYYGYTSLSYDANTDYVITGQLLASGSDRIEVQVMLNDYNGTDTFSLTDAPFDPVANQWWDFSIGVPAASFVSNASLLFEVKMISNTATFFSFRNLQIQTVDSFVDEQLDEILSLLDDISSSLGSASSNDDVLSLLASVDDLLADIDSRLLSLHSSIAQFRIEQDMNFKEVIINLEALRSLLSNTYIELSDFSASFDDFRLDMRDWISSLNSALYNHTYSVNEGLNIIIDKLDDLIGSTPNSTVPNADGGIGGMVDEEGQIVDGVNDSLGEIGDFDSVMSDANTSSLGQSLLAPLAFVRENIESILNVDTSSGSDGLLALCLFSLAFGLCMFVLGKSLRGR